MNNQFLLIEDVEGKGRSGDIVKVKPGFARNYLLPKRKAVVASKHTVRLQETLKKERAKRSVEDRKAAEALAKSLEGKIVKTTVKVDQTGHLYGSVSAIDIVHLLEKEGIKLTRRNIVLPHPIKLLGVHEISLKLDEGIPAVITLEIHAEEPKQSS